MEKRLKAIEARNARVEADKAWETSKTRKALICLITYVTASLLMLIIGVHNWYLGALVPTLGYFLSTLTIPFVKAWGLRCYR